jgi:hypothetical protein
VLANEGEDFLQLAGVERAADVDVERIGATGDGPGLFDKVEAAGFGSGSGIAVDGIVGDPVEFGLGGVGIWAAAVELGEEAAQAKFGEFLPGIEIILEVDPFALFELLGFVDTGRVPIGGVKGSRGGGGGEQWPWKEAGGHGGREENRLCLDFGEESGEVVFPTEMNEGPTEMAEQRTRVQGGGDWSGESERDPIVRHGD